MEMLSFKPVLAQDGLFLEEKFFGQRRVFKKKKELQGRFDGGFVFFCWGRVSF